MIPDLGLLSLSGALALAILLSIVPLAGIYCRRALLIRYAAPLSHGVCLLITLSISLLGYSFATDDFSVMYVAQHSNSQLPLFFKVAAVWGGHEGSMLFWLFSLSIWTALVATLRRRMDIQINSTVLAILGLIMVGFCLFILLYSNPFERVFPAPMEGRDLNPMLQDIGLIFHPPLLYLGYVGFAVNFAFAIAALLSGRMDAAVAYWSRPWALAAWICLTAGIILGSWWAYYELGWGGWWFWDPVENASLMPWLLGTALLHALIVTEQRGTFSYWSLLLSIFTFALSLLGTFIVRSGVLTSVHAFAVDPDRGIMLLLLLGVAIVGALTLFALRANTQSAVARFSLFSREALLLMANVLLSVATLIVLIGTFYPMLFTALGLGSISVGAPYFNSTFVPPVLLILMVMGISPLSRWKSMASGQIKWLVALALLAVITGCVAALMFDRFYPMVAVALVLSVWVIVSNLTFVRHLSLRRSGVLLAHCGVAVTAIGITLSSYYSTETGVKMGPGGQSTLSGYQFHYDETKLLIGPNYTAEQAVIRVTREGKEVALLMPERRHYTVRTMLMSEPGISWNLLADLYVVMGEKVDKQNYALRFHHKPFIRWVWGGGLLMVLGGGCSLWSKRGRKKDNAVICHQNEVAS
ncbi:heme lyase CcmF/NrfE family subunit [Budviciaceae bacterium CWB-B4]|uniref:Heme lyase CcmF/NrfE family subunit n=1 Tax=Limnobaculum xujianqingii TaxID=2738837 RepID=A0A9D7FYN7_9GAMM|nr:heme lyase CcmF/NrfE family subunit [Limnobaculum xujianqingii]MBK5074086.1 heme lyase CcmF/NrfE family subunit [Limnobaculum xujianqingii]MBK5177395.1 heme lyase CcmF/NrfE family subunit [Limnobaculum xujianqingii]